MPVCSYTCVGGLGPSITCAYVRRPFFIRPGLKCAISLHVRSSIFCKVAKISYCPILLDYLCKRSRTRVNMGAHAYLCARSPRFYSISKISYRSNHCERCICTLPPPISILATLRKVPSPSPPSLSPRRTFPFTPLILIPLSPSLPSPDF